jgi:hypothetical protein
MANDDVVVANGNIPADIQALYNLVMGGSG